MEKNMSLYDLIGIKKNISDEDLLLYSVINKTKNTFTKIRNYFVLEALTDKKFREIYDNISKMEIPDRDKIVPNKIKKENKFFILAIENANIIGKIGYVLVTIIYNLSFFYFINKKTSDIVVYLLVSLFSIFTLVIFDKLNKMKSKLYFNFLLILLLILSITISINNFLILVPSILTIFIYLFLLIIYRKYNKFKYKANIAEMSKQLRLIGLENKCNEKDKYISAISLYIWKKLLNTEDLKDCVLLGSPSIVTISAILSRFSGDKVMRYPFLFENYSKSEYTKLANEIKIIITNKYGSNNYKYIIEEIISDFTFGASEDSIFTKFSYSLYKTID